MATKKKAFTWDMASLSKAYEQGCLAGSMGMLRDQCPYHSEVVAASWEAGWEDGVIQRAQREQPQVEDTLHIA
ncbi:MAG: hypothetical protein EA349_02540 [Halomonadaceae bacterium]|nr:MAG: hypothetical protein EA349_02540 [Halomonadaceae bacterium]